MSQELKPCPFCGSELVQAIGGGPYRVVCQRCGSNTGPRYAVSSADAIAAWNTRVSDTRIAELEAEVERLRAENSKLKDYANMRDIQVYDLAEALKPFTGENLPSSKCTEVAYNSFGLRCLMSPLVIARNKAIDLLRKQKEGQAGEPEFEARLARLSALVQP